MKFQKWVALTIVLVFLFSFFAVAQVDTAAVKRLKLKKADITGFVKGSVLMDVSPYFLGGKEETAYLFKLPLQRATPADFTSKYIVGLAGKNGEFIQIGTADTMDQIYNGQVEFDPDKQSYPTGQVIVVARLGNELPKVVMMGSKIGFINGNFTSESAPDFDHISTVTEQKKPGAEINEVSFYMGDTVAGVGTVLAAVNTIDKSESPFSYDITGVAFLFDRDKGFSTPPDTISLPRGGSNSSTHFSRPSSDFWAGYSTGYTKPSYPGNDYPDSNGGTIIISPGGRIKGSFSIEPAAKARMREVVKSSVKHISYPLRQPNLVKLSDGSSAVVYQSLEYASNTSKKMFDIDYYLQKLTSKGKASGKPMLLAFPAWKSLLKEVSGSYAYSHYQVPSVFTEIEPGKYCFLELLDFERRYFGSTSEEKISSPAKAQDTDIQGRVLTLDVDTGKVTEIAQLKLKFSDKDFIHRCWANEREEIIEFVISIYRDKTSTYEVLETSLAKGLLN